ncbi:SufE/NifU family protein [Actinidia rufa]|uniref:Iron-sulfur cluster assembly protein n=1 Tax=Actinidia rufa TaxID=165716 RepID=A0A7J0GAP5_9ERIC|nr:SufE/NifU family protein [Actinidia rufa]
MLKHTAKRLLGLGLGLRETQSPAPRLMMARLYHERVVDHYNHPRNVGSFDKNDPTVGTGLVGAPACGDVMKLQIKVDDQSGKIVDACFKTFGCGSAIASSSVATEWVKGKQMEEVLTIKNTEIAKHLSLPPVKLHCSMLAEDAIKAAVKDYEAKRAKSGANSESAPAEKSANA